AMGKYFPPKFESVAYNCPHCGVYTRQYWGNGTHLYDGKYHKISNLRVARCEKCGLRSYWIGEEMVYPITSTGPMPSVDMPEDVRADFQEARNVVMVSPRAAAALLRLALQKLMPHLDEKGDHINDDIASLVQKGLPETIQKTLDSVRVTGNNAVHPGQMDIKDDTDTAITLFNLLNLFVDVLITQPVN
ncbi:unnamed protein product, partial [marine sediment metagenome]